jgi:PAS fold
VKRAAEEARKTGIGRPLEYRIMNKDGTWRALESTSRVVKNAEGHPDKLIIVNRDISDRKRASEALRLSEASFRSVIENASYGIYRANAAGKLTRLCRRCSVTRRRKSSTAQTWPLTFIAIHKNIAGLTSSSPLTRPLLRRDVADGIHPLPHSDSLCFCR